MEYYEPRSLEEALSILQNHGDGARIIAGGSDVMVDMRHKEKPACLVNIKRIPGMKYIKEADGEGDTLRIGALTTIRDIEVNSHVKEKFTAIWEASCQFASLQIRNTATIGGNVCRASPAGEMLAPLLVYEARAKVVFPEGEKNLGLESFFLGPSKTVLGGRGILREIEVPYLQGGGAGVYLKHAVRGAMDIAMVGVAVAIMRSSEGRLVDKARIGLGAVAATPIRARRAEGVLRGKAFEAELVQRAAEEAAAEARPITDHRASDTYRRWVVEALTARGLTAAWKRAVGEGGLGAS